MKRAGERFLLCDLFLPPLLVFLGEEKGTLRLGREGKKKKKKGKKKPHVDCLPRLVISMFLPTGTRRRKEEEGGRKKKGGDKKRGKPLLIWSQRRAGVRKGDEGGEKEEGSFFF